VIKILNRTRWTSGIIKDKFLTNRKQKGRLKDENSIINYYALDENFIVISLLIWHIIKCKVIISTAWGIFFFVLYWSDFFDFHSRCLRFPAEILLSRLSETFGVLLSSNFRKSHDSSRVEASFGADDSWQVINRFL